MSAFMINRDVFQAMANTLALPLPSSTTWNSPPRFAEIIRPLVGSLDDHVSTIVREWYDANRRAVGSRYGERCPRAGMTFRPGDTGTLKPTAMVKALHCLRYQCAEDVAHADREKHAIILAEIQEAATVMACAIVEASEEYREALWGDLPV